MNNYVDLSKEFENASNREENILELIELRTRLIEEEWIETEEELYKYFHHFCTHRVFTKEKDIRVRLLKELCDLVYVCVGTAVSLDMDFDTGFRLVHENNMLKCTDIERADNGKILKKNNHPKPNLEDCV